MRVLARVIILFFFAYTWQCCAFVYFFNFFFVVVFLLHQHCSSNCITTRALSHLVHRCAAIAIAISVGYVILTSLLACLSASFNTGLLFLLFVLFLIVFLFYLFFCVAHVLSCICFCFQCASEITLVKFFSLASFLEEKNKAYVCLISFFILIFVVVDVTLLFIGVHFCLQLFFNFAVCSTSQRTRALFFFVGSLFLFLSQCFLSHFHCNFFQCFIFLFFFVNFLRSILFAIA